MHAYQRASFVTKNSKIATDRIVRAYVGRHGERVAMVQLADLARLLLGLDGAPVHTCDRACLGRRGGLDVLNRHEDEGLAVRRRDQAIERHLQVPGLCTLSNPECAAEQHKVSTTLSGVAFVLSRQGAAHLELHGVVIVPEAHGAVQRRRVHLKRVGRVHVHRRDRLAVPSEHAGRLARLHADHAHVVAGAHKGNPGRRRTTKHAANASALAAKRRDEAPKKYSQTTYLPSLDSAGGYVLTLAPSGVRASSWFA